MSWQLQETTLIAMLLGSLRAVAWLTFCPPFNARGLPGPARALLSVAIALAMAPGIAAGVSPTITALSLFFASLKEVAIGAALGFCTQLIFTAVQAAGSLLDLFGGFALAFAFDPLSNTGNSIFGRFYNLIATTLLFVTGAHQAVFAGFARSYQALPPATGLSMVTLQRFFTGGIGQMFLAAVQISAPLLAVLFLADVALAVLSRVSPALNVFNLAYPAKILLTMIVAGAAIALLPGTIANLTDQAVSVVLVILGVT